MKSKNRSSKKKTLLFGPYPPPVGGISVHIKRLSDYLNAEGFTDFEVFDDSSHDSHLKNMAYVKRGNKLVTIAKLLLQCDYDLIHYHSHNWIIRFLLIIIGKIHKCKIFFTFHSFRDEIKDFSLLKRYICKYVIKNGDQFIAVSQNEKHKLISCGCDEKRVSVIPAFITPDVETENNIPSKAVIEFVHKCEAIMVANASGIRFYKGKDLYGIDMCIEAMGSLINKYSKNVGLILLLPQIENVDYYNKLKAEIRKLAISESVLIISDSIPMHPIIKLSSVLLRPTNTDGDAISVREALYYKIPVVASDISPRPEGTILFKSRDQSDFESKILDVISKYDAYQRKLTDLKQPCFAELVLRKYKEQLFLEENKDGNKSGKVS